MLSDEDEYEAIRQIEGQAAADDWLTVQKRARHLAREDEARRLAKQMAGSRLWSPPPPDLTETLASTLATERDEVPDLIQGIWKEDTNVTVTGQYKAGKTRLAMNAIHSLVDKDAPFLGSLRVSSQRRVGFWSLEMTRGLTADYARPMRITDEGQQDVMTYHGLGYRVNLLSDQGRRWAIDWLRDGEVETWFIDSVARLQMWAGVDPNDNQGVLDLLLAIDEIKAATTVRETALLAHTGRGELAKERARGATVFDDWADSRWVLTRDGNIRFFQVEGRNVDFENTSLKWDDESKHLSLGIVGKEAARLDGLIQTVVQVVTDHPGMNVRRLRAEAAKRAQARAQAVGDAIQDAIECGFIRTQKGARPKEVLHFLTPDVSDSGKASIRTLDFSQVKGHNSVSGGTPKFRS